ncbi:hypothetical protein GDO86_019590 [Hymenochirus boettgeri]|uniref:Vitelline membrane outer layer 1-like protein n=1 Tax=Hymenochirus boettgeri TaxID=247094 RepID=A0A8T2IIK8_9PIPI|nr:hypothetical protein GDO86_019590 [Hymenochirus boettgeri]
MLVLRVSILVLLSFCLVVKGRVNPSVISVSNGGHWGKWGPMEQCPTGLVAKTFSLKVDEHSRWFWDDSALNGISLHCFPYNSTNDKYTVTSLMGPHGNWSPSYSCTRGFLTSFSLRVEPPQGLGDDTAANNIKFRCSDKCEREGNGRTWGSYGPWSQSCQYGICGIQTKVEMESGFWGGDTTALNDVQFHCCHKWF